MCCRYWLRALEMSLGRHHYVEQLTGMVDHYLLECANGRIEAHTVLDHPQPRRGGYLIVPAPTGVKLGCDVTNFLVKHSVDHRVDVFIGLLRLLTIRQPIGY